jgi:hypothetical protein
MLGSDRKAGERRAVMRRENSNWRLFAAGDVRHGGRDRKRFARLDGFARSAAKNCTQMRIAMLTIAGSAKSPFRGRYRNNILF